MLDINKIYHNNGLAGLKSLPDNSIDTIITSPPYYNLRSYNTEPVIFSEHDDCEHEFEDFKYMNPHAAGSALKATVGNNKRLLTKFVIEHSICKKCGAFKGELGHEPTLEMYIKNLVLIFKEAHRVLKPQGSLWVNIGDVYGKNKSLCQVPNRFAIAMTDFGWILRNEIIWHKPNAMPESVQDRFTIDFEKMFFFVKQPDYYFEKQYEPLLSGDWENMPPIGGIKKAGGDNETYSGNTPPSNELGRNKRTVWSISTQPYSEAHFATYPFELIETPIKSTCPENGIVLNIFMGSGTTAIVSTKLNRNYIGFELNPEYIDLATDRIRNYFNRNAIIDSDLINEFFV
jgi:site-specific DNA-methyltransferase (adenine-specific)